MTKEKQTLPWWFGIVIVLFTMTAPWVWRQYREHKAEQLRQWEACRAQFLEDYAKRGNIYSYDAMLALNATCGKKP